MTRIINAIDAQQAARMRAILSGTLPPPTKKPKVTGKPKQLLSEFGRSTIDGRSYVIQIALHIDRNQYNAGGAYWVKAKTAKLHVDMTLGALCKWMPLVTADAAHRERLSGITFTRLSPGELDPDNLPSAFKHVKDACFAWIKHGAMPFNRRAIGHFDKNARQRCYYKQQKSDANPKAHGIQIYLHFERP